MVQFFCKYSLTSIVKWLYISNTTAIKLLLKIKNSPYYSHAQVYLRVTKGNDKKVEYSKKLSGKCI